MQQHMKKDELTIFFFNKRKNICKQPCLSGTRKSTCVNVQEKRNSTHNCKDCNTTC